MNETSKMTEAIILQDKLTKYRTNHLLHFILSFLTAGLWTIMWFLIAISNASQRRLAEKQLRKL